MNGTSGWDPHTRVTCSKLPLTEFGFGIRKVLGCPFEVFYTLAFVDVILHHVAENNDVVVDFPGRASTVTSAQASHKLE